MALVPGLAVVPLARARRSREPHEPVSGEVHYGRPSRTDGRTAASPGDAVAGYDASNGLRSARPQPWKSRTFRVASVS